MALNFLNSKHKTNFTRNCPIVIDVGSSNVLYGLVTSSSGLDYLYIRLISGEKMKIDFRKVKHARLCDYTRAYNKYHLLEYTANKPLKRCPFCGRKPRRTLMPDGRITFRCSNTNCVINDDHQGYDSLSEASIDWNRRVESDEFLKHAISLLNRWYLQNEERAIREKESSFDGEKRLLPPDKGLVQSTFKIISKGESYGVHHRSRLGRR
jgi:hypothetical protein